MADLAAIKPERSTGSDSEVADGDSAGGWGNVDFCGC